jgi:transcriptional regulator with XRE-family HTH domain
MNRIAQWLETKRHEEKDKAGRPMSKAAFADKLGISQPMYWYVSNGQRAPGPTVMAAIARVYPDAPVSLFLPDVVNNCSKADEK